MAELLTPDICVIGAGSGGLSVAAGAAAFGVPVVLIERDKMGGDCLNYGCVPSKALLAAAKRARVVADASRFGIKTQCTTIDFLDVHGHIEKAIQAIAPNDSRERFTGLGVQVIAGMARFRDRRTVTVGERYEIRARRFVIATGSRPAVPAIPGLADCPYLTNETIFNLTQCPEHLVVIGAGSVGLEMAQAHRRLGAEVTVLEAARPLGRSDPECVAVVLGQLAREGITIRSGVKIARIEQARPRVRVVLAGAGGEEVIEGSHLLVAAGRRPNIEDLNLEAAGIAYEAQGIRVNRRLKTTNRKVYAIGDVVLGSPQFTHVASYHAGLVLRNALFRLPVNAKRGVLPQVIFTEPELAQVGLNEEDARKHYAAIRLLRWPYADNDRAQTEGEIEGHIKLVTDKRGRLLGATIVGPDAGELITLWTLAIGQRLTVRAFLDTVFPYPTRGEIGKRAAVSFYIPRLTGPWTRRIIDMLRRLG